MSCAFEFAIRNNMKSEFVDVFFFFFLYPYLLCYSSLPLDLEALLDLLRDAYEVGQF